jgi:prepilin-type N-terminal cleavage/methylation domain-containing protein
MKENGFTLVELLAALVAGSLLLVALGWAIRGLGDQYRRHATAGAAERVAGITPFLEDEIGRALPPARGAAFGGNETQLALTVPPPRALGAVGPVRLDLSVIASRAGKALVARFGGQGLPEAAARPVTLADGFRDIRFSYLRRANDLPATLPRLITIQFTAPDGTVLPLGIVPRLTMAADCVFDPISLACRP